MYSGYGFHDFEIGDVHVIKHGGVFHLFDLTLPNQSYIAHAISADGLEWRRVKNALFISDPPAWDDDMLWTMHVSPNPYKPGSWRMFYTGLCMSDRSRIQRIGLAHSYDLYDWEKDPSPEFPLEIDGSYYEHSLEEGRHWVSFRDPFCFQEDGEVYLLAAARVKHGPVIRRGCVALMRETAQNRYEFRPPLFESMHYDDIEVPNLFKFDGRYYLIGSIREDIKVHYWWSDRFEGPYRNFSDNVLMPQGNYAARISQVEDKRLIWNFFYQGRTTEGRHLMAPPKELITDEEGGLHLKSFEGFDKLARVKPTPPELAPFRPLMENPNAAGDLEEDSCWVSCESGFEAFLLNGEYRDFILTGVLNMEGDGKCGLVFRLNDQGDGYYLSLDLFKGIAQLRAWGHRTHGFVQEAFHYNQLQVSNYVPAEGDHPFRLVAYKQNLEFSLNGYVLLSLADDQYEQGQAGFYVENAKIRINDLELALCDRPPGENYPKDVPNY
jgi:beta-fructofuranosidase